MHIVTGCFDCKLPSPNYMLKESVWLAAWPDYKETKSRDTDQFLELCFSCLEHRLGRQLQIDDFTDAASNGGVFIGFRIGLNIYNQRKGGKSGKVQE